MSWQAVAFVKKHSRHKHGAFLCLLLIAEHAHPDGTNSCPGLSLLAEECRMNERHVRRLIDSLEASGELTVDRGRGRGNGHRYTVVMGAVKPDISDIKPDILPGIGADKTGHFVHLKPDISDIKPDIFDSAYIGKTRVREPKGTVAEPKAQQGQGARPEIPAKDISAVTAALGAQGITASSNTITGLIERYGRELVEKQVRWLPRRTGKNRLAVLTAACRDGYEQPGSSAQQPGAEPDGKSAAAGYAAREEARLNAIMEKSG